MITREQWVECYIPAEELTDLTEEESATKQAEIEAQYLAYLAEDH